MADSTLIDPFGRTIVLNDHTWFGHIVKGHPEMAPLRREAELAVTKPISICYSKSDVDCRVYFGNGPSGMLIAVVANIADPDDGYVLTGYVARAVKGMIEW